MRILTGKKWREGFLDYHRNKAEYRIEVLCWKNLERLENVYHTRPKSLRLLWNYLPVVGFEGLLTKTWSRLREDRRNEKYVACGVGTVIEGAGDARFPVGSLVCFVAPWHPALAERIVLPEELVFAIDAGAAPKVPDGTILHAPLARGKNEVPWWKPVRAWSVYSGINIQQKTINELK